VWFFFKFVCPREYYSFTMYVITVLSIIVYYRQHMRFYSFRSWGNLCIRLRMCH